MPPADQCRWLYDFGTEWTCEGGGNKVRYVTLDMYSTGVIPNDYITMRVFLFSAGMGLQAEWKWDGAAGEVPIDCSTFNNHALTLVVDNFIDCDFTGPATCHVTSL